MTSCYISVILVHMDIINELEALQKDHGITDQELADKLGIHRVSWARIKRLRRFSKGFVKSVRANYPDIFLPKSVNEVHTQGLFNRIFSIGRKS